MYFDSLLSALVKKWRLRRSNLNEIDVHCGNYNARTSEIRVQHLSLENIFGKAGLSRDLSILIRERSRLLEGNLLLVRYLFKVWSLASCVCVTTIIESLSSTFIRPIAHPLACLHLSKTSAPSGDGSRQEGSDRSCWNALLVDFFPSKLRTLDDLLVKSSYHDIKSAKCRHCADWVLIKTKYVKNLRSKINILPDTNRRYTLPIHSCSNSPAGLPSSFKTPLDTLRYRFIFLDSRSLARCSYSWQYAHRLYSLYLYLIRLCPANSDVPTFNRFLRFLCT